MCVYFVCNIKCSLHSACQDPNVVDACFVAAAVVDVALRNL